MVISTAAALSSFHSPTQGRRGESEGGRRGKKTPFFLPLFPHFLPTHRRNCGKAGGVGGILPPPYGSLGLEPPPPLPPQGGIRWGANGISDGGGGELVSTSAECTRVHKEEEPTPTTATTQMPAFFHANYHYPLAIVVKGWLGAINIRKTKMMSNGSLSLSQREDIKGGNRPSFDLPQFEQKGP